MTGVLLVVAAHAFDGPTVAASADADRIYHDLAVLTGEALPPGQPDPILSRSAFHPDHDRAASWLAEEALAGTGLELWAEPVHRAGLDLTNLGITLPGADPDLDPWVLAAHWDSTATASPDWDPETGPAPGADDNASGVAATLEAARLLATWTPGFRRTIQLILFDGEELGLYGSEAWVDSLRASGGAVAGELVLDPVGYNPGDDYVLWVSHDTAGADAAAAFADAGATLGGGLSVVAMDAALWGGDTRSDHAPFQQAGWIGLHAGSFPQPRTYHTSEDTLSVVDLNYVTRVAGLSAAWIGSMSEPLPAAGEAGVPQPDPRCGCQGGSGASLLFLALVAGVPRRRRRRG